MKTQNIIKSLLLVIVVFLPTVTIAALAPTVTIVATPITITYGATGTIKWSSTNASSCTASGGWTGTKPTSGTFITPALTQEVTYTISCTGTGGTKRASITQWVQVSAATPPVVTLTATPTSVAYQGSSALAWTSTNATSCTASNAWSGNQLTSGKLTLSALLNTATYTLVCNGNGGSTTKSVTINVTPNVTPPAAPTVSLSANPSSIVSGASSVLNWTSTNATSCTASNAWSGNQLTSGQLTVSALLNTATYTLVCNGNGGSATNSVTITVAPNVTPPAAPTVSLTASPPSITSGASSVLNWSSTNATSCVASNGWTGAKAVSGSFTTPALTTTTSYTLTCTGASGTANQSATITVGSASANAGSKMGINISWVNDWGDRDLTFIDVMKQARGFGKITAPWDPANNPVPLDANGWPTTDFGVYFISNSADPLNRPLTTTFPSMFGIYKLSFTGQATVNAYNCCQVQNAVYNPTTDTTTADVVVQPTDDTLALTFTNTKNGVKNLQLLRPGYPIGITQVFTSEFLKALAPFSTIRVMEALETNGNPESNWTNRKLATDPTQQGSRGIAWEYVIQLANATGKDIWINIPHKVDLNDLTVNNYVIQLATLLKKNLNPNIHVYVEYSNELWNTAFSQTTDNTTAAVADVNSGADKTLNYDNVNNQYYWGYRRYAHQTLKMSQLFAGVFGPAAMNTIIRPVYVSQYDQPYLTEDALTYLNANFGAPNQYLYAIGGAPYFSTPSSYTDINTLFTSLLAGLNSTMPGFSPLPAYNGGVAYTGIQFKNLADYYGLKSVAYEGGPDLSINSNAALAKSTESDIRINQMVQAQLANFLGCGNDLFVYYKLAGSASETFGAYEDVTVPTQKSKALNTVAATPLSSYTACTSAMSNQLFIQ
ncbi:MAG: hypothetical protein NTW85_09390 [Methylococcales bacterium]|nr:hypothetical protein [Methylococcales bacterium]